MSACPGARQSPRKPCRQAVQQRADCRLELAAVPTGDPHSRRPLSPIRDMTRAAGTGPTGTSGTAERVPRTNLTCQRSPRRSNRSRDHCTGRPRPGDGTRAGRPVRLKTNIAGAALTCLEKPVPQPPCPETSLLEKETPRLYRTIPFYYQSVPGKVRGNSPSFQRNKGRNNNSARNWSSTWRWTVTLPPYARRSGLGTPLT